MLLTKRHRWFISFIVLFSVAVFYYSTQHVFSSKYSPSIIYMGVLPDQNPDELEKRYAPLVEYLSRSINLPVKLIIPKDYSELLTMFGQGEVDLAYFGGFTFLQAEDLYGALPLVMREVDTRFTSWFLVTADNPAVNMTDLKGKKFSFGNKLSTSGHLMPRFYMQTEYSMAPQLEFAEVLYSGAHDKTAYWVRDGLVDIGVANAEIIRRMFEDGRLKDDEVRVLWETPPYSDYVWTLQGNVSDDIKIKLRNAFLLLNKHDPIHQHVLANMGTDSFLPAGSHDFSALKTISLKQQLLGKQ